MQNIVATFDDPNSARYAMERIQEAGIPRERIRFMPSPDTEFLRHAGPSERRPTDPNYKPKGFLESIGGFFANLLESHTDESGIYSEALRRGTSMVMVQVERDEAKAVIAALQDCGAINLEDRVGQWRAAGWEPPPPGAARADVSPARAGTLEAGATLRGGPVGTHSFTGGGSAVGMPRAAATEVGGAGARADGSDMADTGGDPTLPPARTAPAAGEAQRLRERAVAATEPDATQGTEGANRQREPGANR